MTWQDTLLLVEAARWAPSAGNSQPWMLRPIVRGTREHDLLLPLLAASSRVWAADADVIVLNMRRQFVVEPTIEYSEFSDYDLGQAVAHMTFQAQFMGLACRQFRAFDHERVTRDFCVPPEWDLRTMTAVGLSAHDSPQTRSRQSLSEVLAFDTRRPATASISRGREG